MRRVLADVRGSATMRGFADVRTRAPAMVAAMVATIIAAGNDAHAQPAGWVEDVAASRDLVAKANATSHFGGAAKATVSGRVFPAPQKGSDPISGPGIVFMVTTLEAPITAGRDLAARAEIDDLHAATRRAELAGGSISELQWEERVDEKQKLVLALGTWRDNSTGITTLTKIVIAADDQKLVATIGECMVADKTDPTLGSECFVARARVEPSIPVDKRVAFGLAPAGSRPIPAEAPAQPMGSAATGSGRPAPTMSDGTRTPLPPMVVSRPPTKRTTDMRPVYVGLGIVVLAAVFWWNRRRRDRFEAEGQRDE